MNQSLSDVFLDQAVNEFKGRIGHLLKSIYSFRILRFLISGSLNTAFGVGLFYILLKTIGNRVNINVIITVCTLISVTFAFVTHKYMTFRSKDRARNEYLRFFMMSFVNYALNILLLNMLLTFVKLDKFLAQCAVIFVIQAVNYLVMKRLIFRAA